jgi:hypothetical protein
MSVNVNIRIPSTINDLNTLDANKFQKSVERKNGSTTIVVTYNDKVPKDKLEKCAQKIKNFFSGVKNARNSITLAKAWESLVDPNSSVYTGSMKNSRFNTNLIPTTAKNLNVLTDPKKNEEAVLPELRKNGSKYTFTLSRTK